MTRKPSYNLESWQVKAALDGRLKAIVVPMKVQPFTNTVRLEREGRDWIQVIDGIAGGGTIKVSNVNQRLQAPYNPGDVIAGKEAWCGPVLVTNRANLVQQVFYKATEDQRRNHRGDNIPWKSAQTMPRDFARVWLTVKDVRTVKVREITEDDAMAAGVGRGCTFPSKYLEMFWQSRHGKKYPWESNPWAWCYTLDVEVRR